jgi:hypothetical protein
LLFACSGNNGALAPHAGRYNLAFRCIIHLKPIKTFISASEAPFAKTTGSRFANSNTRAWYLKELQLFRLWFLL